MNRYLLIGTLATALALFAWQTLSNAVLPWHTMSMREFADPGLMIGALDVTAPENGLYFHERGVVTVVSMVPGVADKTALLGPMLLRQFVLNVIAGFVLALVALRLGPAALRTALVFAGVALGAGIILELAEWNWYGYPIVHVAVNAIDVTVNAFIAGLVLGALRDRLLHRGDRIVTTTPVEGTPATGV